MKSSSGPAPINDAAAPEKRGFLDLELPVDRDFVSRPPFVDPQAMLRRCIENHARRLALTKEHRRLAADEVIVEFKL